MRKKLKIFISIFLSILQILISMCNPMIVYAEETEATTEDTVDFSEEKWQEYAWLVFEMTDWNDSVNINFTLGNDGIAFATDVDNYDDFVGVFEDRLIITLKTFDAMEADGKSLGVKHKYKWVEYEKIIACILYCMLIRDNHTGIQGNIYTFESGTESISLLDIALDTLVYMDDNQREMIDAASDFYICDSIKELLVNDLGYTDENCKSVLWKELGVMYFGTSYIDTFDEFIIRLVRELTKEDGTIIQMNNSYASGTMTYYFDPYAEKESVYGCLNYILLDSLAMKFQIQQTDKYDDSFFKQIIQHEDFTYILDLYLTGGGAGTGVSVTTEDWEYYYYAIEDILNERKDDAMYYIYPLDYGDKKGLCTVLGESYFNYGFSGDVIARPGGESGSCNSFGQFWYENYTSARIVNHTINGATGELIDN